MVGIEEKNLSVLMHELRSPISIMLGIIEQSKKLNSKIDLEKSLEQLEGVASYLLSLSNNYLEISRNENAFLESASKVFNFDEVINYVLSVFNFQFSLKNITFSTNILKSDFMLFGECIRIKQILINVLSNAYKYTPRGGKVNLECSYKHINMEEVEFNIIVNDSGIGMSKEFLEKIFTPFNRERNEIKPNGTGLGLYIIKRNVELLKGSINIDSIRGCGTSVMIKLPMKISNVDFDFSKKHILIIDDCKISQQVVSTHLSTTGAICDIACDGEEGLNKFLSSPINYYQVIVMDNKMTKLDGEEVTRMIRKQPRTDAKKVKIIGISASKFNEDINNCINAGMNEYLLKPFTKENLLYTIYKQIEV